MRVLLLISAAFQMRNFLVETIIHSLCQKLSIGKQLSSKFCDCGGLMSVYGAKHQTQTKQFLDRNSRSVDT